MHALGKVKGKFYETMHTANLVGVRIFPMHIECMHQCKYIRGLCIDIVFMHAVVQ